MFHVQDLGEVAARLGSPDLIDRRGKVIFIDTFEGGIYDRWINAASNSSTFGLSNLYYHSPITSLLLYNPVTNPGVASGRIYLPTPSRSRIGFEFMGRFTWGSGDFEFQARINDGVNTSTALFQFYDTTHKWRYWGADDLWHDMDNIPLAGQEAYSFTHFKFVIDYSLDQYVYAIINNQVQSLEGISMSTSGSSPPRNMLITFTSRHVDGAETYVFIDNLIITQDED
jgi:hypothetical protein